MTDDLIAKMGKASDDQIKEAENAAKAQEQQDAQQNAQQAGQTTAVNTRGKCTIIKDYYRGGVYLGKTLQELATLVGGRYRR